MKFIVPIKVKDTNLRFSQVNNEMHVIPIK